MPGRSHHTFSFSRAVGVSVVAHAAIALTVALLPTQQGWVIPSSTGPIDAQVSAEDFAVFLAPATRRENLSTSTGGSDRGQADHTLSPSATIATPAWPNSVLTPAVRETSRVTEHRSAESAAGAEEGTAGPRSAALSDHSTIFFQIPAKGRRIVYLIDRSSSMGLGGLLTAVKQELLSSLGALPPKASFQVIFYNRIAEPLRLDGTATFVTASPRNISKVEESLRSLVAEGGTDHVTALRMALVYQPDVIYLLTDAAELRHDQLRAIASLNRCRTVIHAIELTAPGRDHAESALRSLAQQNGGVYRLTAVKR